MHLFLVAIIIHLLELSVAWMYRRGSSDHNGEDFHLANNMTFIMRLGNSFIIFSFWHPFKLFTMIEDHYQPHMWLITVIVGIRVIPVLFKFPTRCHHPLLSTFVRFVFVVDLLQFPDKETLLSETFTCQNDWKDMNVGTIRWTHRYWPLSDVFLKEESLEKVLWMSTREQQTRIVSPLCAGEKRDR